MEQIKNQVATLNKTVKTMRSQQVSDQERILAIERENMIGKYKLVGKGVPRAKKGEDCSLIVAQCARKVTSGEVIFGPGDIMGNATRLEGCKAKNPPITVRFAATNTGSKLYQLMGPRYEPTKKEARIFFHRLQTASDQKLSTDCAKLKAGKLIRDYVVNKNHLSSVKIQETDPYKEIKSHDDLLCHFHDIGQLEAASEMLFKSGKPPSSKCPKATVHHEALQEALLQ